jgi:CheY-like chemotaxis protein
MAKILLVEDDNNLREIYEARLQAEGYDIVAARDGEEALVVAKKELPDLVISDVMMPKISGFEMLDILRNTDGLKDVKVIMLTALGQAEDQTRANSLGADRYLVKSQVTLEDIVNAAHDLLNPGATEAASATPAALAATEAAAEPAEPATTSDPAPVIPLAAAPPEEPAVPDVAPQMPPTPASTIPDTPSDVNDSAAAPATEEPAAPTAQSDDTDSLTAPQEQAAVTEQINSFIESQSGGAPAAVEPAPDTEPAPAPEVTTPETPAEPAAPTTTTAEQEQALNDAVNSLTPPTETEAPAAPASDAPKAPETPDEADTTSKRVIAPLSPEAPKKSLEELLAAETAKAEAPKLNSTPTNPGTQPPSPTAQNGDFDPNSIAL